MAVLKYDPNSLPHLPPLGRAYIPSLGSGLCSDFIHKKKQGDASPCRDAGSEKLAASTACHPSHPATMLGGCRVRCPEARVERNGGSRSSGPASSRQPCECALLEERIPAKLSPDCTFMGQTNDRCCLKSLHFGVRKHT